MRIRSVERVERRMVWSGVIVSCVCVCVCVCFLSVLLFFRFPLSENDIFLVCDKDLYSKFSFKDYELCRRCVETRKSAEITNNEEIRTFYPPPFSPLTLGIHGTPPIAE